MLDEAPEAHAPRPAARAPATARRAAAISSPRGAKVRPAQWWSRRPIMHSSIMRFVLRVFVLNLWWCGVLQGLQRLLLLTAFLADELDAGDALFRRDAICRAAFPALRLDARIALLDDKGLALHRFANEALGLLAQGLLVHLVSLDRQIR